MKKIAARLLLLAVSLLLAAVVAELLWRCVRNDTAAARMYFRDDKRAPIGLGPITPAADLAFRASIQAAWPNPGLPAGVTTTPAIGSSAEWFGDGYAMPRASLLENVTWLPGAHFFICYTGPRQDYFDADGCVEYRFNRFGIRDRDDLTLDKPAGVRRVVCLGDSFTLGWGVRQEHDWPVLVEQALRKADPTVQVINCGGAGSAYVDEYELALRHRHGRFQPDVVLVSLCLNDLLVTNGKLCHFRTAALPDDDVPDGDRPWWRSSRLLSDLARRLAAAHALDLDPGRDWVAELEHLPADHLWYRQKGETPDCYWVSGRPQQALHRIHEWCDQHGARAAVVVWPFLQSLDVGAFYPFTAIHDAVRAFCAAEGAHGSAMPFLDLLPVLRGQHTEDLWVSPADMHPNERAQRIVAPALADFVAGLLHR
jgi:hypothetical protein